jgi:undecaprenyl-diphosphatase
VRALRQRRAFLLVGLFAASALGLAGLAVLLRQAPPAAADLAIGLWLQQWRSPGLIWLMVALSWLGYAPQSVLVTAGLAGAAVLAGRPRDGAWLVGTQLGSALGAGLKLLVERPRPTEALVSVYAAATDYGFPSGHVVFYATLFGFAFFLVFVHARRGPRRTVLLALLAAPIPLIGIARVYLGLHWPSDVLGGYALASVVLVPYCALYARTALRRPAAAG